MAATMARRIDRSAHMTKEAEMLALADEFDGEAKANRALGDAEEARKCFLAAKALRAAARPAPTAGVGSAEACPRYDSCETGIAECHCLALALKPTMAGEPVAWRWKWNETEHGQWNASTIEPDHLGKIIEPLYASPAPSGRDPATIEALKAGLKCAIATCDEAAIASLESSLGIPSDWQQDAAETSVLPRDRS